MTAVSRFVLFLCFRERESNMKHPTGLTLHPGRLIRTVCLCLAFCLSAWCCPVSGSAEGGQETLTILVYITGSNLET